MSRMACWWSAGAASSVAAVLALRRYRASERVIAYCAGVETSEHPDNARFLSDCERWFGQPILKLYAETYTDIWDVFEKTGWLIGPAGARCTTELKKLVRRRYQRVDDIQVFGFTADPNERVRADRFTANNPECDARFPLIELGLTHADCEAFIKAEGIELPAMYRMGYRNNNCIGCVKGGAGYWNKIRVDFPEVFARMSAVERRMGVAILKRSEGGKRIRVFLDELAPTAGRYDVEPEIECGLACDAARAGDSSPVHGDEGRE